jgi:hypothetical protein
MNGFSAEEFEADAPTDDTMAKANGPDTGNTAWPELEAAAYHGLTGEVVATLLPQTEADPVALL